MTVAEVANQTFLAITTLSFAMFGVSFVVAAVRWAVDAGVTT